MPPEAVAKLANKLSQQRDIKVERRLVEGANHFFSGLTGELAGIVDEYLERKTVPQVADVAD